MVKKKKFSQLFAQFLEERKKDIADGYIGISSDEVVYHSGDKLVSIKTIKITVIRINRINLSKDDKDKDWQTSVVYQLKKIGFSFSYDSDSYRYSSTDCKFSF